MTQPQSSLSTRIASMLLVGVVLPVLFCAIDMRLFAAMSNPHELDSLWLFSVFVVQVGVLGVLAARLIELPLLRWSIYAWCWLLIDMQATTAAEFRTYHGDPTQLLVKALFAAQASVVLMWGILGTTRWTLRLPVAVASVPLLATPLLEDGYRSHSSLFLSQLFALAMICGAMRWRGFTLDMPPGSDDADVSPHTPAPEPTAAVPLAKRNLKVAQFGIRHVLIWTTSLAFALGILRLLGLLSIPGISRLINSELLGVATTGTVIAIVLIVALWAGLGQGVFFLRWSVLVLGCLVAGLVLIYLDFRLDYRQNWQLPSLMRLGYLDILGRYWHWLAWTSLAGGLLFATLLMFRTLGYRLVWTRRVPATGVGDKSQLA